MNKTNIYDNFGGRTQAVETTSNKNYFAYIVVSIRRTSAAYSTTGVSYETN
jgi:hypothetical protein